MAYTTESFIKKANEVHNCKYDYSKTEYIKGNKEKIRIICPEHGEFWQRPGAHLVGCGCPECGKNSAREKVHEQCKGDFVKKAKKIHGDKYDYSKVNYVSYYDKVCIICPEHGEFWQTPDQHFRGCGCPECGRNQNPPLTNEEFIEKARQYIGEYDYSKVNYKNSTTPVEIVCKEHGSFFVRPGNIKVSKGCPKCVKEDDIKKRKEKFLLKAHEKYGDRYDYSKVIYNNWYAKVCIIDKLNGKEFNITPERFLLGKGLSEPVEEKWTYEVCMDLAKKYAFEEDFRRENNYAWNKAKKRGWIKEYTWLKKDLIDRKDRLIYVYEFSDGHAYVGLTQNLEKRDLQHRMPREGQRDSVIEHSVNSNVEVPQPKIIANNLSIDDAKNGERKWIKEYAANGWKMLNKVKGGQIGGRRLRKKHTKEELVEICKSYKNMEEVYNKNRYVYNEMMKMGVKRECFPNAKFRPNMAKPREYTEDFLLENIAKYNTLAEIKKNDKALYHWLYAHKRVGDFFRKDERGHNVKI